MLDRPASRGEMAAGQATWPACSRTGGRAGPSNGHSGETRLGAANEDREGPSLAPAICPLVPWVPRQELGPATLTGTASEHCRQKTQFKRELLLV